MTITSTIAYFWIKLISNIYKMCYMINGVLFVYTKWILYCANCFVPVTAATGWVEIWERWDERCGERWGVLQNGGVVLSMISRWRCNFVIRNRAAQVFPSCISIFWKPALYLFCCHNNNSTLYIIEQCAGTHCLSIAVSFTESMPIRRWL